MSTSYPDRTRKMKGSTRLRPWTPADRRTWRHELDQLDEASATND